MTSDDAGTLAERIQNVRHILSYATQDEAVERAIDALGEIVAEVGQLRERVRAALIDAEDPWADATSVETYADAVMAVLDEQEG